MNRTPRRWWLRRSLHFRITVLASTITLVVLLALALLASRLLGSLLVSSVDEDLSTVLAAAARQVREGEAVGSDFRVRVRVLNIAGEPVDDAGPVPLEAEQVRRLKAGLPVTDDAATPGAPALRWLGRVVTAPDGSQRLVAVGAPLIGFDAALASGSRWLLMVALVSGLIAAVGIWFAVRWALRRLGRMRRAVRGLGAGARLPLPDTDDELHSLAAEFNSMLTRQEQAGEQMRRFTDDAAHELRSPVASIRVQAEVALANPDAGLEQETLADVLAETERLSGLLDGLLALARADARELPPAEPVDLVSRARAAVERLPAESVRVRMNPGAPRVWASCAPAEVELVVDNLLRNACSHARGQVTVSVLLVRSRARLVVDDDGPGIAPGHRAHVFERFYRASEDRARDSGGSGLGLAMVAEAVRRRGGRVSVGESPEGGARFHVGWPAER